ncbi:MAG: hypothetical protein R3C45_13065 [Phycisphaerales bacterium]
MTLVSWCVPPGVVFAGEFGDVVPDNGAVDVVDAVVQRATCDTVSVCMIQNDLMCAEVVEHQPADRRHLEGYPNRSGRAGIQARTRREKTAGE